MELSVLLHNIKYFVEIQETVCKFQSQHDNFVHVMVKVFWKSTKELPKDLMDICFVVLYNLVQRKSVIAQTFFPANTHPLCVNFNVTHK